MGSNKVLIVEDESIIALSLKLKLEALGYEVIDIIDQGEKALEIAEQIIPDLILMDIRLAGEMDGIDTAMEFRQKYDVPSIFLTAYVDDDTVERAKQCLPVGYLQKPFDDSDLRTSIEVGLFKEEMQKELREHERKLDHAHEIARLSHWEWNGNTNSGHISDRGLAMMGVSDDYFQPNQFLENLIDLIHPRDQQAFLEEFNNKIFSTDRFSMEFRITSEEKKINYFHMIAEVVEKIDNKPKIVKGIFQDVTERKELELQLISKERQLQESQKLESMGRLAGAIAHDFNNYLTLLLGNIQLMKRSSDPEMRYYDRYEVLLDTIKYASSLTNQLLTFSKKQVLSPEIIDINLQIEEISELLKILAKSHNFVISLDADKSNIMAESSQIQQIMLNLVSNAVDAMPTPGTIQVKTKNVVLKSTNVLDLDTGDYVLLSVMDNGLGMDEETKQHAFEPFYTSDISGKHSGIGLSTVYGITKQFGGAIRLLDNPNESGTLFELYFPIHSKEVEESKSEKITLTPAQSGTKRILLIEDNQQILKMIETIFNEEGDFEVITQTNGNQGLQDYKKMDGQIDLVITDILLPSMNGIEIVHEIQKLKPEQKILLISGFIDSVQVKEHLSPYVQFLPKPFLIDELLSKIEILLNPEEQTEE